MGFISKLQQLNLVQSLRDFLFSKNPKKSSDEIVQLWTVYRNPKPFSELSRGFFPKAPENGMDGQQKGVYFWNQKGGTFAWLRDGGVYLEEAMITLMASTVLKRGQLAWPDWKIDAVIHKDLLCHFLLKNQKTLWKEQGHDVLYPINQEFVADTYDADPYYDESVPHLTHCVLIAKDGAHIRDEVGHFDNKGGLSFEHKNIKDYHFVDKDSDAPIGALERAVDCLCQNNIKFRAAYNEMIQKLPFQWGLRALKYCGEESLPVAIVRSVVYGAYSKVEYVNPILADKSGKVRGECENDTFLGRLGGQPMRVSLNRVYYHEGKCKITDLPYEYELNR